ncbi:hypothetical protein FACS189418_6660 [Clostridia bacterium]|nr:hypothetical protein FACS189418_6660 [Clostridia bacterium]
MKNKIIVALGIILFLGIGFVLLHSRANMMNTEVLLKQKFSMQTVAAKVDSSAGKWEIENQVWYYKKTDGTYYTGWLNDQGKWYYFDKEGKMQIGWLTEGTRRYFFQSDGEMLSSQWLNWNNRRYYLKSDGAAQGSGWFLDQGVWYFLNSQGEMYTGWMVENGNSYYLREDGGMHIGWLLLENYWHYFQDNGAELRNAWLYENGNWYYLNRLGQKLTNAVTPDGYTVDGEGRLVNTADAAQLNAYVSQRYTVFVGDWTERMKNKIFVLVNEYRQSHGLSALQLNSRLVKGAEIRAKEISSSFLHARPDGRSCFVVMDEVGYYYHEAGENAAYYFSQKKNIEEIAISIFEMWKGSPEHNAMMLHAGMVDEGLGFYLLDGTVYAIQLLGSL